uniref:DAGKc domain-containing protein n=1 Tax=Romanomermis culicivorax TaxID=13658 RepID=A0A915JAY7_ROMCU
MNENSPSSGPTSERVIINDKVYKLKDSIEFLKFEPRNGDPPNTTAESLKIKKCEIFFSRIDHLAPTHFDEKKSRSCVCGCRGRRNFISFLNHKKLKKLAEQKPLDKKSKIIPNILTIFLLRRAEKSKWRISYLACEFKDDVVCKNWKEKLDKDLKVFNRPKNLLIFVNPFGGKGKAKLICNHFVRPLLDLANLQYKVIETRRANHARDSMLTKDYGSTVDGILAVGGDGLFSEVMNGLLIRSQKDAGKNVDNRNENFAAFEHRIAAIPAGSTNAFAYTLHGTDDPLTAMLHVLVGDKRKIDLCSIHCGEKFDRFAFTAVSFGFLGDVLKSSEKLRCLGPPRYLVAGLKTAVKHPIYTGTIEYHSPKILQPTGGTTDLVSSTLPVNICHANCEVCKLAAENSTVQITKAENFKSFNEEKSSKIATEEIQNAEISFVHVIGVVTPALCKLSPSGLSPTCHLGDGIMHLAVIKEISPFRNGIYIASIMANQNDHLTKSFVDVHQVTGFSYTPNLSESKTCEDGLGTWNVDGEILPQPENTIHFRMHKQLIPVFARGIEP